MEAPEPSTTPDPIHEQATAKDAQNNLWLYLTVLPGKTNELLKVAVDKRFMVNRHTQFIHASGTTEASGLGIQPTDQDPASGSYRSITASINNIGKLCQVRLCVNLPGLDKGDIFRLWSSYSPYGFAALEILKYDASGTLQTIHRAEHTGDAYVTYLTWPWK